MSSTATFDIRDLLADSTWIERLARGLVRGEDGADDLVQDAWEAALRAPPASDRPMRPWLRAVLGNKARNRARDRRRRSEREAAVGGSVLGAAPLPPDALVEKVELQRTLADLVLALPERVREAVLLRYYQGLPSSEIAALTGVPAGTVRWRLKEGLAELRRRLEERHGGDWKRALMPLGAGSGAGQSSWRLRPSPSRRLRPSPSTALLLGAVLAGAVGAGTWLGRRDRGASRGAPPEGTMAAAAGSSAASALPPAAGSPRLASPADDLAACLERLRDTWQQLREVEGEWLALSPGTPGAFEREAPNGEAEAALRPIVEGLLREGSGGAPPPHTFECRTWTCRLGVLWPMPGPSANPWMHALQRDPALVERTYRTAFTSGPPWRDPASGRVHEQRLVFMRLRKPSGEATSATPTPSQPPADGPSTATACLDELTAGEREIGILRAQVLRHQRPSRTFAVSPVDPALTEEVARDVYGALPPGTSPDDVSVECRGDVCRVEARGAVLAREPKWNTRIERHVPFRLRLQGSEGVYYRVSPRNWALGGRYLMPLLDALAGLPGIAACERRFRDLDGWLDVYLEVVGTDRAEHDPPEGTLVPFFAGPLLGSPFNECVSEAVDALVAAAPRAPTPLSTARSFRRFSYPRTGPPRGPLQLDP